MIAMHIHPRGSRPDPAGTLGDLASALNRRTALRSPAGEFAVRGEGDVAWLAGELHAGVEALGLTLAFVRRGTWDVVVDVATDGAGEGALASALERARRSTGRCAVAGLEAAADAWTEPALQLLCALEVRRSEPQQHAGRLVEAGASQREVAAELGVSQQAVHARLRGGLWHETRALAGAVAAALDAPGGRT